MSGFKLLYVNLPHHEEQDERYLFSKEFIPYGNEPEFQHGQFSLRNGFLLKGEEY